MYDEDEELRDGIEVVETGYTNGLLQLGGPSRDGILLKDIVDGSEGRLATTLIVVCGLRGL